MSSQNSFDVIIVGAGLAGLTAAWHLTEAGKRVAILEARDRVGGRIHAAKPAGSSHSFDLGPAWFWPHHHQVAALLKQFGLKHFDQYESGLVIFEQGTSRKPQRFKPQWEQPRSYRIVGGTLALIEALLTRLPADCLHLNQAVQTIEQVADQQVTVQSADNTTWQADHAIVTLPPHLAATTIQYEPALPQDILMVMRQTPTWMGEAMKASLLYETPFWRQEGLSGMAVSYAGPVQQFHDATPADESVGALFGWVGNHSTGRSLPADERRQAVIDQAVRLYGPQAANPLHYDDTNWEKERFTTNLAGPDRVLATEHPNYGHPLLQRPQLGGSLWWAATEVSGHEGGYLEGAIAIGEKVAGQIIEHPG